MTDAELLEQMGTDARKWADGFIRLTLLVNDLTTPQQVELEGCLIGWFANAIEAGRSAGQKETCSHTDVYSYDDLEICRRCGKANPRSGS